MRKDQSSMIYIFIKNMLLHFYSDIHFGAGNCFPDFFFDCVTHGSASTFCANLFLRRRHPCGHTLCSKFLQKFIYLNTMRLKFCSPEIETTKQLSHERVSGSAFTPRKMFL